MLEILSCLIVAITDGDTLKALCGNEELKIRIAEIDAPEKSQAFGTRSKQSLSHLCYKHQAKITPQKLDRYKRLIARVSCQSKDASAYQVSNGMAWVYDKYATDPSLYPLQDAAKRNRRGLWADANPIPPWEMRKK